MPGLATFMIWIFVIAVAILGLLSIITPFVNRNHRHPDIVCPHCGRWIVIKW